MLNKKALSATAGGAEPIYIEDTFSTYLYTGNGSTQTITNGIDLSGEGGLVWLKGRSAAKVHVLVDTARGSDKVLQTQSTAAQITNATIVSGFSSSGFSLGTDAETNANGTTFASWTFRKAEKFFDVVTYTGNGSGSGQVINHNLGSAPGCIIAKATSTTSAWAVYHKDASLLSLNATNAAGYVGAAGNPPTSTTFNTEIVKSATGVEANANGVTYVAYLFAHDAGGFGDSGSDSVIKCGSFDGTANTFVDLGWEPQWIMFKNTTSASNWQIIDNMRGMPVGSDDRQLMANLSNAESDNGLTTISATGFTWLPSAASNTYIYIAIRRGPMKTPEAGTEVFSAKTYTGNATARAISGLGFPPDLVFPKIRDNGGGFNGTLTDRLRGVTNYLVANDTSAEATNAQYVTVLGQDGFSLGTGADVNRNTSTFVSWNFRRAPGFFDVVCFNGTGSQSTAVKHNLGVAPELIIEKTRSATGDWYVQHWPSDKQLYLQTNAAGSSLSGNGWVTPTSTDFYTAGFGSSTTEVAYLFASVAGVSKVGSYTGTGTTLQVNCGFTSGARFVLIKRADSTGDWYVWDTARGIVSGNDPYLLLNSTAAEVTNTDYIDTYSSGFEISSTAPAAINANGGTFIYLAIA
jgi:hypothetical protein